MRFTLRRLLLGVLFLVLCGVGWFGWQAYQVYIGLQHITGQRIAYVPREPTVTIPSLNGNQRYNILVLGTLQGIAGGPVEGGLFIARPLPEHTAQTQENEDRQR